MRFLIDADLPDSTVAPFKENGFDVDHVREVGLGGATDADIVSYAAENGYVIVTRDQGFGNPLEHDPADMHGVIILRVPNEYRTDGITDRIGGFLENVDADEIGGSVIVVEEARYRVRPLSP